MPNLIPVLNDHFRRIARREFKPLLAKALKRGAEHRRTIAALKRELKQVQAQLETLKKRLPEQAAKVAPPPPEILRKARLRLDGLKAHRQRLGLSAAEYGKLMGVSALTVYHWERGKTKPRRSQLPNIVAVRGIGKREALDRLRRQKSQSAGSTSRSRAMP